jgi:hypothetical protein
VEKLKLIAARNPAAPVQARSCRSTATGRFPNDLLLTVLYTAGQAELRTTRFVVLQKGEGTEG